MTSFCVNLILKRIDLNYNTNYYDNKPIIEEWYKDLIKYDYEDVNNSLDRYMKYDNSIYPPKRSVILRGLKTREQKDRENNLKTICPFCYRTVHMKEFNHHYGRCLDLEFIEKNVKKYLGKDIDYDKYYEMSDEELEKQIIKISKIVYDKTTNDAMKNYIKKYLEGKKIL